MFTTELRVNGNLIAHIYGRNVCTCVPMNYLKEDFQDHDCTYEYDYYDVETRTLTKGTVEHNRQGKLRQLIATILMDVEKKEEIPEPKNPEPKKKEKARKKRKGKLSKKEAEALVGWGRTVTWKAVRTSES